MLDPFQHYHARTQTRQFKDGDYVCEFMGRFPGYALNVRTGFEGRQSMSIHLEDDVEHFTRRIHSAGYEVILVRDWEVYEAERRVAHARDRIKDLKQHIKLLQDEIKSEQTEVADAREQLREAKKIPTKIEMPKKPYIPR